MRQLGRGPNNHGANPRRVVPPRPHFLSKKEEPMSRPRVRFQVAAAAAAGLIAASLTMFVGRAEAATATFEAENATITDGVVESVYAGFTGTGYVNGKDAIGSGVQWSVQA